eukprot:TRINITY_DN4035_c0_g1_i1.p1 TRINITY_DN4035_c0_g1~~TRINITY_DN4035_c0_g1_i1.p1  ORF type:complete len:519 (-),score=105.42 TRINITY_DN4035_c0_g1_i1:531-2087(-)
MKERTVLIVLFLSVILSVTGYQGNRKYDKVIHNYGKDDPSFQHDMDEGKNDVLEEECDTPVLEVDYYEPKVEKDGSEEDPKEFHTSFRIKAQRRENFALIFGSFVAVIVVLKISSVLTQKSNQEKEIDFEEEYESYSEELSSDGNEESDLDDNLMFDQNVEELDKLDDPDIKIVDEYEIIRSAEMEDEYDMELSTSTTANMISTLCAGDISNMLLYNLQERLPNMSISEMAEVSDLILKHQHLEEKKRHNDKIIEMKRLEIMCQMEMQKKIVEKEDAKIRLTEQKIGLKSKISDDENLHREKKNEISKRELALKQSKEDREFYEFLHDLVLQSIHYSFILSILMWCIMINANESVLTDMITVVVKNWEWFITPAQLPQFPLSKSWFGGYTGLLNYYISFATEWGKSILFIGSLIILFFYVFPNNIRMTLLIIIIIWPFYSSLIRIAIYLLPFALLQYIYINWFFKDSHDTLIFPLGRLFLIFISVCITGYLSATSDPLFEGSTPGLIDNMIDWIYSNL